MTGKEAHHHLTKSPICDHKCRSDCARQEWQYAIIPAIDYCESHVMKCHVPDCRTTLIKVSFYVKKRAIAEWKTEKYVGLLRDCKSA